MGHLTHREGVQDVRQGTVAVDGAHQARQFRHRANPAAGAQQALDVVAAVTLVHGGVQAVERRGGFGVAVHEIARLAGQAVLQVVAAQGEMVAAGGPEDLLLHKGFIRHAGHPLDDEGEQQIAEVGVLLRSPGLIGQALAQFLPYQEVGGGRGGEPVLLHKPRCIEHHVSAAGGESALVAHQVLHRYQVIIFVLDILVVFLEHPVRAEDRRFQKHFSLILQAHDAHGGEQLGNGGQAQAHVGGHGHAHIGPSVPARIQERIVARDGQGPALQAPEVHETVNGVVHARQLGELVGEGSLQVGLPGYRRFLCGRHLPGGLLAAQQYHRQKAEYEGDRPHPTRPARRP